MVDDAIYYRDGLRAPVAEKLLIVARTRMYELFVRTVAPTGSTSILDVGVSDEENSASNFLEKLHPHRDMITCAGLGDGASIRAAFPDCRYVRITAGAALPFPDKSFDVACSNAVLEHVGGPEERRRFLSELLRVSRTAFVTLPNGLFPVEHHTSIPFLHFAPALFRRALRGTRLDYWSRMDALDFLTARSLARECAGLPAPTIVSTGLPLGPFSSNLALIWQEPRALS